MTAAVSPSGPRAERTDTPTYRTVHTRLVAEFGPAADYPCYDGCGRTARDWSYEGGDPDELVGLGGRRNRSRLRYSADLSRFVPRCKPCHSRHDRDEWLARQGFPPGSCNRGHDLAVHGYVRPDNGNRYCRTCNRGGRRRRQRPKAIATPKAIRVSVERAQGCERCGKPLEQAALGRPRRFCGDACKKAAQRWRAKAGAT